MKNIKNFIVALIITIAVAASINYFTLPAWNIESVGLWIFIMLLIFVFGMIMAILSAISNNERRFVRSIKITLGAVVLIFIVFLSIVFSGSRMVNSKRYASLLQPKISEAEIKGYQASINNVPLLDKESAMLIANRELGSLIDVVSQFEISDTEQITVKGNPVRVAILEYGSFFKWMNNQQVGTPGYIIVDMRTQDAELIRVQGGIKYSPSELFGRDLYRYLRKSYPTLIFENPTLELNEDGHPYWIAPIIDHTIGLFGGKDIIGTVTVDAVTGELNKYDTGEIPEWLDNVYSSELIMQQYDDYGSFQSGFWNSIFGQRGVKVTTEGYNYIPQGDDNYIYTGVTSAGRDESNIGFILSNKRTKETIYYAQSGAEEYSAMSSAEGMVQDLGYKSTFPLLLNIEGQPTYVVALKDAAGLVKLYGMINVEKYQIVAIGDTVQNCQNKYRELLKSSGTEVVEAERKLVQGKIEVIREAIKNGTTFYYIKLENDVKYYSVSITENEEAILLNIGDDVKLMSELGNEKTILSATLAK